MQDLFDCVAEYSPVLQCQCLTKSKQQNAQSRRTSRTLYTQNVSLNRSTDC
jgi:hypothetical protein